MLNALEIYNQINDYKDIQGLIGTQESIFLDFKTSTTLDGNPTSDDKNNFKEAISGFSHQEGGVIIWGIDCRVNKETGVDEAIKEKPIVNVGDFQKRLEDFFPYTTEPLVDGVQNKIISLKDELSTNKGFLIHYIPKSYKVHRILNPKKNLQFYKRYSSQFRPIETTEEIRALFFRQFAPELEVDIDIVEQNQNDVGINFSLINKSFVSAKFVSVFITNLGSFTFYDGGGNDRWDSWTKIISGGGTRTFNLNNGFVLHPEQISKVFIAQGYFPPSNPNVKKPEDFEYVVYAENMEPKKGIIYLKKKE